MPAPTDSNGNFHHPENGKFTAFEDYVKMLFAEREKQMERVFAERETSAEFKRLALKEALDEQKLTTAVALAEAKTGTAQQLADAKDAADEVIKSLQAKIEKLESGGAPFANRLDEGMTKLRSDVDGLNSNAVRQDGEEHTRLKHDVEVLNVDAVRTKVLDALREQTELDQVQQKRMIRGVIIGVLVSLGLAGVNLIINLIQGTPHP